MFAQTTLRMTMYRVVGEVLPPGVTSTLLLSTWVIALKGRIELRRYASTSRTRSVARSARGHLELYEAITPPHGKCFGAI